MKNEERENLTEHRHELRDLSNVMVEETEKTQLDILNSLQFRESQYFMSWEEMYLYEIMRFSYYTDHNKDELGLEGGTEGYNIYNC